MFDDRGSLHLGNSKPLNIMLLGLVIGTATATCRHPSMESWKLLVVQPLMADGRSVDGDPVLAIDRVGAGRGENVMISSDGASCRELLGSDTTPVRWTIIGIRD